MVNEDTSTQPKGLSLPASASSFWQKSWKNWGGGDQTGHKTFLLLILFLPRVCIYVSRRERERERERDNKGELLLCPLQPTKNTMRKLLRTANEKEDQAKCPVPSNYLAPPAYHWGALWRLYPHSPKEGDVENANLAKVLSVWDLIAYGIGSTVGAGIFVVTGVVAREKAGLAIHHQQAVLPFFLV